ARAAGESSALSGALSDHTAEAASRSALVGAVFGSLSSASQDVLRTVAEQRWSSPDDLVGGIEEMAVRAVAQAESADIEGELFRVTRVIAENPDLELALGSRLGEGAKKGELIERILASAVSEATILIASSI